MSTTVSHPIPSAQAQAIADLTGYEDAATLRWQQACVQAANAPTALPNGHYVNVRMERMRQGLELAQRGAVTLPDDGQDLSAVVHSGSTLHQIDMRYSPAPVPTTRSTCRLASICWCAVKAASRNAEMPRSIQVLLEPLDLSSTDHLVG